MKKKTEKILIYNKQTVGQRQLNLLAKKIAQGFNFSYKGGKQKQDI